MFALLFVRQALSSSVGRGIAKSTYAATDPFAGASFLLKYLPVEVARDDCSNFGVCECPQGGFVQQGRVALIAPDGQSPMSMGFGLHFVNVTYRVTTGGIAVADVESAFAKRLGGMEAFDAFMDYNVGFMTANLTPYTNAFDADDVPYLLQWFTAEDGVIWYSATVLVPGSHMVVEIFSTTFFGAVPKEATSPRLGKTASYPPPPPPPRLAAIRVSRATKDIAAVDEFYQTVLRAYRIVETPNRHCFQLYPEDQTLVCYTEHADDDSEVLTVAQFEDGVNAVHAAQVLEQPMCGMDKWLDNHFALDNSYSGDLGDHIVSLVDDNTAFRHYYFFCQSERSDPYDYSLHYIVDPTGWGIQLDIDFSFSPAKCYPSKNEVPSSPTVRHQNFHQHEKKRDVNVAARDDAGQFNPACNPGICDALQTS